MISETVKKTADFMDFAILVAIDSIGFFDQ